MLKKLGLPTGFDGDVDEALSYVSHDKKSTESGVDAIFVSKIGGFEIKSMSYGEFYAATHEALGK